MHSAAFGLPFRCLLFGTFPVRGCCSLSMPYYSVWLAETCCKKEPPATFFFSSDLYAARAADRPVYCRFQHINLYNSWERETFRDTYVRASRAFDLCISPAAMHLWRESGPKPWGLFELLQQQQLLVGRSEGLSFAAIISRNTCMENGALSSLTRQSDKILFSVP